MHENAYLGDLATSEVRAPEKPIACGFYRLEKGTPLVYTYTYHEMKIIVDGEFDISDERGNKVHAVKGDVFYFPEGSVSECALFSLLSKPGGGMTTNEMV